MNEHDKGLLRITLILFLTTSGVGAVTWDYIHYQSQLEMEYEEYLSGFKEMCVDSDEFANLVQAYFEERPLVVSRDTIIRSAEPYLECAITKGISIDVRNNFDYCTIYVDWNPPTSYEVWEIVNHKSYAEHVKGKLLGLSVVSAEEYVVEVTTQEGYKLLSEHHYIEHGWVHIMFYPDFMDSIDTNVAYLIIKVERQPEQRPMIPKITDVKGNDSIVGIYTPKKLGGDFDANASDWNTSFDIATELTIEANATPENLRWDIEPMDSTEILDDIDRSIQIAKTIQAICIILAIVLSYVALRRRKLNE